MLDARFPRCVVVALAARLAVGAAVLTTFLVFVGRAFIGASNHDLVQPFDDAVRTWVQSHLHAFTGLAGILATIGATIVILLTSVAVTVGLWVRTHDITRALLPMLSVLVADTVGAVTKVLVARPRPTDVPVGFLEHYSFPSGHTVSAAALAAALFLVWRSGGHRATLWPGVALAAGVGVVAVGRLVLDAHWATDVIAATAVGVSCALIVRWAVVAAFGHHLDADARDTPSNHPRDRAGFTPRHPLT